MSFTRLLDNPEPALGIKLAKIDQLVSKLQPALATATSIAQALYWAREKAGTIEHVHDEVKNGLGGGHLPSQHFAVNAAWFKLALLAYNLASAIKGLCFSPEERTVRFKKYRLLLVQLLGRMSRNQCKLRLRFCASAAAIARVQRVWEVFALPTQATAFR